MANMKIDYLNDGLAPTLFPNSPVFCSKEINHPGLLIQHHCQPEHETFEHSHQQHIIGIPVGRLDWLERKVDGRIYKEYLTQGDIGIYPAQQAHQIRWKGNAEFILLCLDLEFVKQAASQVGMDTCIEFVPHLRVHDLLVHQIGLTLKTELKANKLKNSLYVESLFTTLLFHLLKHYSGSKPDIDAISSGKLPEEQLKRVLDYIHDRLNSELSVDAIAQEICLSQYHFSRLFKQSTGIAPHQYVMQQRLEKAKQLLKQSNLSLVEIAYQCGFANQSHFTKTFRKLIGMTPMSYRKGL